MKGVNKVILVGHMGKDPECSTTQGGDCVARFSIATTEKWKDSQGQPQEKTEWHNCVAFKRLGEIVRDYGRKGQAVYIEGKNRTKKYTDQQGVDHYPTSVAADEFRIIHDPNYQPQQQQQTAAQAQQPAPPQPPQPASRQNPNGTAKSPYAPPPTPPMDQFDDDIPF